MSLSSDLYPPALNRVLLSHNRPFTENTICNSTPATPQLNIFTPVAEGQRARYSQRRFPVGKLVYANPLESFARQALLLPFRANSSAVPLDWTREVRLKIVPTTTIANTRTISNSSVPIHCIYTCKPLPPPLVPRKSPSPALPSLPLGNPKVARWTLLFPAYYSSFPLSLSLPLFPHQHIHTPYALPPSQPPYP